MDSTPSAQVTTVPLAAVDVVVRARRLLQVEAVQPPRARVARGAARDQDPAQRPGEAGRREEVSARPHDRRQADTVQRRHGPDGV